MIETAGLNRMLNSLVSQTYLGLLDSNGTELSGTGYARYPLTATMFTISGGVATNNSKFYMEEAETDWGTAAKIGIFTSLTGGSLLYTGTLTTPQSVLTNYKPKFPASSISITITSQDVAQS